MKTAEQGLIYICLAKFFSKMQKILFYLLLLVFPLGQLCRFTLPSLPAVVFHPLEVLTLFFVVFWFIKKIKEKDNLFFQVPLFFKRMSLFILVASFSLVFNYQKYGLSIIAIFYLLRLLNYFVFYWAAKDFFVKNKVNLKKLLYFEGIVISVISLGQYLFIPDTRFLSSLGWDMHYFRAIGSFLDPSYTGIICTLSFLAFIDLFLSEKSENKRNNYLFIFSGAIILLSIAFSFSRISYLSLLLSLAVYLWLKNKKKILTVFMCIFVLLVLLLPKPGGEGVDLLRKSSFVMRAENYQAMIQIIKDNFFIGVGYNNLRLVKYHYGFLSENSFFTSHSGAGADNSFLFVLATTGILGLMAYLYLLGTIIKKNLLNIKQDYSSLLLASLLSVVISSLVINSLFYSWILFWLMLLLAKFTAVEEK